MRPDRRFGVGRTPAAAWLAVLVLGSTALGQGWTTEPVDPKGHVGDVVAVAVAGQSVATAGSDGLAKIWDLSDPAKKVVRLTHRVDLTGHAGKVLAIALTPDGNLVATGGADGSVRLWDAAKGSALATFKGHSGPVETLAFAADGKTLASGGLDASIRLWDVNGRQILRTITGHEQGVRGLAFSPDGTLLASASRDQSVKLWVVADGTEKATLGKHNAPAWCVAFAPDGLSVASGSLDKTIRLWRVGDPPVQPVAPPQAAEVGLSNQLPRRAVFQLQEVVRAQVPDAVPVPVPPSPPVVPAGGSVTFEMVAAQVNNGENPPSPNQVASWAVGDADPVAVAFTPDGHHVAAALANLGASRTTPGSVVFLALPSLQPVFPNPPPPPPRRVRAPIRGHLGPILGLAIPKTGDWVATVGGDASLRVWSGTSEPIVASIGRSEPGAVETRVMAHLDPVEALAISPDGRRVVTASESAGVTLWDATTRTLVGRLRLPNRPARTLSITPDGRTNVGGESFVAVRALAISPDGKTLATGGDGKIASLWDLESASLLGTLKGHLGAITALAFSPDGKTLASGSKDASVTLWDVKRKAETAVLARHTSAVTTLAFSPDGSLLATAGLDYAVKLWEVATGRYLDTLDAHQDVVDALVFSVDGKTLASGDRAGSVRTWDVAARAERTSTKPASNPLHALAFAPDGKSLVGGGDDGSIRRWDLADAKVIALRTGAHAGPILTLAFGPGGKTLATGGTDRELKLWDVDARLVPGPFADLEGKVRQLAVSPDGLTLATASADHFVRVWDVATGRERFASIPILGEQVRLAFSSDSKKLATLVVDDATQAPTLWDVASGRLLAQPGGAVAASTAFAFAPDGGSWAIAQGKAVQLWGVSPILHQLQSVEATHPIRWLAFSPDGKGLAGLGNGSLTIWDVANFEKDPKVHASQLPGDVFAYSPDSRSIAVGNRDRTVRVLDAETGGVRLTLRGPRKPITGVAYSPDGKLVAAAADGDPILFAWDAATGEVVSNPTMSEDAALACLAFAPDGKALFAGGNRGVATFAMSEGHRPPPNVAVGKLGKERATLKGHTTPVRSLAFVSEGTKLVTRAEDGSAKVWNLADGNRDRQTFGGSDFKVNSMAIRPDGKTLAVGLQLPDRRLKPPEDDDPPEVAKPAAPAQKIADEVKLWDIDTGEGRGMISARATNGGSDRVVALAYSVDGKLLATTSRPGGKICVWDAESLESKVELEARSKPADLVQFSPDGKTLMGADASGLVTLWDVETGKLRASFTHDHGMNQVFYSPDGKTIATAGSRLVTPRPGAAASAGPDLGPGLGGDVRLWDPATGHRLAVLPMESGKVTRIAFSRDGKSLAASTTASVATIWDVESTMPVVSVAWPTGEAKYLAFAPDGKTLAIGGEDQTLRVFDVPAGTLRADLIGHEDAINWVAFSPDGKTLATAGRDTVVKLWDLPAP